MKFRRVKRSFLIIGIFVIIFCSVRVISDRVFCYDSNVAHPRIAELAIDLYNQNFDPDLTKEDIQCILAGAREEDTPTRWLNHFYDPVHNRGLKGVYSSAKSWAENPSKQASYALGDQSWQRALDDYKNDEKKKAFTELGHVLHLIADMSVPAHTRNDVHVMPGDSYEQFLKNNWNTATAGVAEKSKVRNISSLSSAFDALATYSNSNFYSDDTIEDKNYNTLKIDGSDSLKTQDDKKVSGYWFLLSGQKVYTFAEERTLDWFRTDKLNAERMMNVPSIITNHTSLLVPEAVGYSAGVIKLFFSEAEKLSADNPAPRGVQGTSLPFFRQNLLGFANLAVGKVVQTAQGLGDAMKERFGGGSGEVYGEDVPVITNHDADNTTQTVSETTPKVGNTNTISPYQGETKRGSVDTMDFVNTDFTDNEIQSMDDTVQSPSSPTAFAVTPTVTPVVVAPAPVVHYGGGGGGGGGSPASDITYDADSLIPETTTPTTTALAVTPTTTVQTPNTDNQTPTTTENFTTSTTDNLQPETPTSTPPTETPTSTPPQPEAGQPLAEIETPTSTDSFTTSTTSTTFTTSTAQIDTPTSTENFTTSTTVVINEIAWAGTGSKTSSDEWIELYNNTDSEIDLTGWKLFASTTPIVLSGVISPRGYYLMERTKDDTVSRIAADLIFTLQNGLNNSGEHLILKNSIGEIVDEVNCSNGWFAGTDGSGSYPQAKYRSMERKNPFASGNTANNWRTNIGQPSTLAQSGKGADIMGTPRQSNNNFWLLRSPTYYYSDQFVNNVWHLTKEHSPYVLDFKTEIPVGYTIVIDPGVIIVGTDKSSYFDVKGELQINGAPEDQVVFTSARDSSRLGLKLNSWTGEPEPGDWSRIDVSPGAKLNISNAQFYYGGSEFKKQGNWVYSLQNISQVIRNIAGSVEINQSVFYNSFIGANDQQYSAVVWTETQVGKSASTTIKNSEFDAGWTAVNNFGQNDGQKIYSEISNNQFKNFLSPSGPIVAAYHLPSFSGNVLAGNNKDAISLNGVSLPGDTTLENGDYEIGGALTVPVETTLTVNSGTNLKVKLGSGIDVYGKLIVSGTDSAPVNIEPAGDDYWGRLDFKPGAVGDLKFAYLRRGNFTQNTRPEDNGVVRALNTNLNIENCAFLDAARPQNMILLRNSQTVIKDSRVAWSTDYESGTIWLTGVMVSGGMLYLDNVNFDRMDVGVDASAGGSVDKDNMPDENFQNIKKYKWLPEDLFAIMPTPSQEELTDVVNDVMSQ